MNDTAARTRRRGALLATSLGFAVVQLDVSVVNVAILPIGDDLGGGVSGLQWVVDGYTVAFAALILSAGTLADRFGARRLFAAGFTLFTLASLVCGLSPSLAVLIAARVLQGVGAAALVPCSLSLITHSYADAGARARAVGLWAAGASVALSGGPLVGGLLTATLGWRFVFVINVPLGLVGVLLTLRCTTETTRESGRALDPAGQVCAVLGLLLLATAVVEGGRTGFAAPPVVAGLVAGLVSLALLVLVEHRGRAPMLPLGLFRNACFAVPAAIGVVINVVVYGLLFVLSLYFQDVRHFSPLVTGLAFLPLTAVVFVANTTAAGLADRWGRRTVLAVAALVLAAGVGGLLLVLGVDGGRVPYLALAGPLVLLGLGVGWTVPVLTSTMLASLDAGRSGLASGTLNTARQTGSVLGVALFGSFAARSVLPGLRLSLVVSLVVSLGAALAVAVLARQGGRAVRSW